MNSQELIVFSIWALTVVVSVFCIGKLLWGDAVPSPEEPLGVRFAFSCFAFAPSLVSLVDGLLTYNTPGNGGEGANNWIFIILLPLNLLAAPIALLTAICPPYSRRKLLQHAMSGSVALSALAGAGAMMYFALDI